MNWYYALGGQQQGPVDDAQFEALIAAGTITPDTLVWREGMANWQALRTARPASAAPGTQPIAGIPPVVGTGAPPVTGSDIVCVECGKSFPRENAIQYGTSWVCAGCKPIFLQKLKEGASTGGGGFSPGGPPVDPETLVQQVLERGYQVDLGSCISRAWELTKSNFWLGVGTTFLVTIAGIAAGSIPILGYCAGPILQGPLIGGLYWFFLKLVRGQDAGVNDGFSGFSPQFVQLMLFSVVSQLLFYVWMIPGGVAFFMTVTQRPNEVPVLGIILILASLPFVIYLAVIWLFTLPLMMDRKYGFWDAMNVSRRVVNKQWFNVFLLGLVLVLLQVVGMLALCVGVFVTMTIMRGAITYAYEDIFNPRPPGAMGG